MTGRLREDRSVGWAAAAAGAAAAPVEDRQLDAGLACDLDELFLRAVDLPLRCEEATVLAGVGVPDHDLEAAVAPNIARSASSSSPTTWELRRRSSIVSNRGTPDRGSSLRSKTLRTSAAHVVPDTITVPAHPAVTATHLGIRVEAGAIAGAQRVSSAWSRSRARRGGTERSRPAVEALPAAVAMRVPLLASRLLASTSRSASSSAGTSYPSLPSRHQMNESLRRYGSSSSARRSSLRSRATRARRVRSTRPARRTPPSERLHRELRPQARARRSGSVRAKSRARSSASRSFLRRRPDCRPCRRRSRFRTKAVTGRPGKGP